MSKQNHRRINSSFPVAPATEDIEEQIDRLNQALQIVMKEIEISSVSRNPSRMSVVNSELVTEEDLRSASPQSEVNYFPEAFEQKIEELLLINDRNEMTIEDYRSENFRKSNKPEIFGCGHDVNEIRREIWMQVKVQKGELVEIERKGLEEAKRKLESVKEEYSCKKAEIIVGIEKLRIKEELLVQKEKELRMQRMAFDKHKLLWEKDHGAIVEETLPLVKTNYHNRAASHMNAGNFLDSPQKKPEGPRPTMLPMQVSQDFSTASRADQLKSLQSEVRSLEAILERERKEGNSDTEAIEMKIDNMRNRIATLRGEIAISESVKATRLISNMMISIEKEAGRDDKLKRLELIDHMYKKQGAAPIKPTDSYRLKYDSKCIENSETTRRILLAEPPKSHVHSKDECSQALEENRKKIFATKEKELLKNETLLQQTWMKLPGSKEFIENFNLTLEKLNNEKTAFEKERVEFEKERLEWLKHRENIERNKRVMVV